MLQLHIHLGQLLFIKQHLDLHESHSDNRVGSLDLD